MSNVSHATALDLHDPPIRMEGVEYQQVNLCHPFAVTPPTGNDWRLYVVRGTGVVLEAPHLIAGRCALPDGTVIGMAGDARHRFASADTDCSLNEGGDSDWRERSLGIEGVVRASGEDVVIVVGRIPQSAMPFLSMMGGFIRIDPAEHRHTTARIATMIDLIAEEAGMNAPSAKGVIQRLAEIITVEIGRVGRTHNVLFSNRPAGAEYDTRIWRAITTMCNEPQRHWTVGSMAQIAGMSRSAFASRYHETMGQTPMRSLRRLRMYRAAMALAMPGPHPIVRVAETMGYGSDAAFNRAFAKEFGHPPKRYGIANRVDADKA